MPHRYRQHILVSGLAFFLFIIATGASQEITVAASDPPPKFQEIHMVDDTTGWAVIDNVYATQDGGKHWTNMSPSPALLKNDGNAIFASFFLDDEHAWVATETLSGGGSTSIMIWRTSDGGHSWQQADKPIHAEAFIAASFSDPNHGWLLVVNAGYQNGSDDLLYQTIDGGATWSPIADDGSTPHVNNKPISQQATGITQGGHTGIAFTSPKNGWMTVSDTLLGHPLRHTTDGGITWQPIRVASTPAVSDPLSGCDLSDLHTSMPDSVSVVAVCGIGSASPRAVWYHTGGDGKIWQSVPIPANVIVSMFPGPVIPQMFTLNTTAAWLVGNDAKSGPLCCGSPYDSPTLYQTVDGGKTWAKVAAVPDSLKTLPAQMVPILKFDFVDDHNGWVIDNAGEVLVTVDGGKNWTSLNPVTHVS